SIFSINQTPAHVDSSVSNATYVSINTDVINDIVRNKYESISLSIPYRGGVIPVELFRTDIFNSDFHVSSDRQTDISYEKGVHYRGIINGDQTSLVSFNFFKNEVNGIASSVALNNLVIGKLRNSDTNYIVYSDAQMNVLNDFACHVKDDM